MSVVRHLTTAFLAAAAVALAAPVAYADPVPPWSPTSEDYEPSGTMTVRTGDRTETWTWEPGHQTYRSSEKSSEQVDRGK